MLISYNWLKWYIPSVPKVEELADIFNYHITEVESVEKNNGDHVFDISILPNRAHDLLSHQGIARELASLLGIDYIDPTPKYKIPNPANNRQTELKIDIQSDRCRRYMGRVIRNVKVGPSPDWVVKHLESIGERSINNLVDAANIVMFDCGQPAHVFDLEKVEGGLVVRQAEGGEKMTTLDNLDLELDSKDLVISDSKQKTLGLAGVKGGKIAEVDENTKNIIIEVANFDPVSVRKSGQRLGIFSGARKRFENDLSPELTPYGLRELSALIADMCRDAVFENIIDIYSQMQKQQRLSFSVNRISQILGLNISSEEVEDILKRYNFKYTKKGETFKIVVPSMRLDLIQEEDMAEEIGRILGYDKVKGEMPKINFVPKTNETHEMIKKSRAFLLSQGYNEVMSYTFRDKGDIEVVKSASDKNFLRTNLTEGFRESIKLNQINIPLLEIDEVKIFEIGTVFKKNKEETHVVFGGKKEIKEMTLGDFYNENFPSKENKHTSDKKPHSHLQKFKMWSLFPFIARDIALWVPDGVESERIEKLIKDNAGRLLIKGPDLFDEFKKPASGVEEKAKISYAFSLVFQSYDRTLTDSEVNDIMAKIANKIKGNNGWQVR